jgi:hypothetical protein
MVSQKKNIYPIPLEMEYSVYIGFSYYSRLRIFLRPYRERLNDINRIYDKTQQRTCIIPLRCTAIQREKSQEQGFRLTPGTNRPHLPAYWLNAISNYYQSLKNFLPSIM